MTASVEVEGRNRSTWSLQQGLRSPISRGLLGATIALGGGLAVGFGAAPAGASSGSRSIVCIAAIAAMWGAVALVDAVPTGDPHGRSERLIRAAVASVVLSLAMTGLVALLEGAVPDGWPVLAGTGLAWAALIVLALHERRIAHVAVAETASSAEELAREITGTGGLVVGRLLVDDDAAIGQALLDHPGAALVMRPGLVDRGVPELLLRRGGGQVLCVVPGSHAAKAHLVRMGELSLVDVTGDPLPPGCRAVKRTIDLAIASTVLLATSPLLLLTAVAIRLDSRGPWLFHQERVGAAGRRFQMHKLRTMRVDQSGERHREYVAEMIEGTATQVGGLYKLVDDDRRTRVGRLLRKLSIDELPQLWNVLRGDMSIVGPRPALPQEVERYRAAALQRLAVRPGLTGLWQVSGRSRIGYDRMVELDTEYWQRWTVSLDLRILAKTPWTLLRGETA